MPTPAATLALLTALAAPAGGEVQLDGAHALELRAATIDEPRPAGVHAASRRLQIDRVGARVRMRVSWRVRTGKPGWLAGALVGGDVLVRRVTVDGRPAATAADGSSTFVAAWIDRDVELVLEAELRGDPSRGPVPLVLLPATIGTATVTGTPAWRVEGEASDGVIHAGGVTHGGAAALRVVSVPPAVDSATGPVTVGRVGVGLFVGDAEMRGRARLQWVVRRGELDAVDFTAQGVGADLRVEGPDVREVVRDGERVHVALQAPQRGVVALEASWSLPTPSGDAVVTPPAFVLAGTGRTDTSFELGRDGDVDVVPSMPRWRPVAVQQLPAWGRDLIEGASAAAWTRHDAAEPGRLQLLRFVPVEAPKVVVAKASFELASAEHGTALIQARYELLNERASHLRVTPPPGAMLLGAEVAGVDARLGRDGDTLLVPIPRSLETLQGLVSTPVVMTFAVGQAKWSRRGRRELPLPTVDAPIREVTARWLLPRDMRATSDEGRGGIRAIVREQGSRRPRPRGPATATKAAQAPMDAMPQGAATAIDTAETDRLLREAQEAYQLNEFDDAQQHLDELRARGLEDEDADKLQSNLDVVNAPARTPAPISAEPTSGSTTVSSKTGVLRRIKDQARARGQKKALANEQRKQKAKELRAKGDYAASEAEYRRVIEDSRRQRNLEQEESTAIDFETETLEKELESVKSEKAAREALDAQSHTKLMPTLDDDAEHGLGAQWLATDATLAELDPPPPIKTPANYGPRVLMPTRAGDQVIYAFDLWAPGSHHSLVVESRRRRHRF